VTPEILRVDGLSVRYHTPGGAVHAADGITFRLRAGERLGIAGESGSGKSTMALALLRLIKPPGRIEAGSVWLDGRDLLSLPEEEMRRARLAQHHKPRAPLAFGLARRRPDSRRRLAVRAHARRRQKLALPTPRHPADRREWSANAAAPHATETKVRPSAPR